MRDLPPTPNSKPSGLNGNHQRMSSRTASRRHKQHQAADPLQRPHVADPETRKAGSWHESPAKFLHAMNKILVPNVFARFHGMLQ